MLLPNWGFNSLFSQIFIPKDNFILNYNLIYFYEAAPGNCTGSNHIDEFTLKTLLNHVSLSLVKFLNEKIGEYFSIKLIYLYIKTLRWSRANMWKTFYP